MKPAHPVIESVLSRYRPIIGADYEKYRNHVCRVFSNCVALDAEAANAEKYAIASAFHDIGIWTDTTFDYLKPSIAKAAEYLRETGREEWTGEITAMIDNHHKLSRYEGEYSDTAEVFRKADWTDVTFGLLRFGISQEVIRSQRELWPNQGFHAFLLRQSVKNFGKHPLNPLPMFKK